MHHRPEDTQIPIETNNEKVCRRCVGQSVIQTQPNITHHSSKRPVPINTNTLYKGIEARPIAVSVAAKLTRK
ncbi:hypothetical protein DPMN_006630 [Dreissena polymorpha]|uniref:Uncharacterized protein n=1 Tax=Dreissena polymorpha TaxID=45954 RepID=A0A9D4MVJ0_DREPO|nr:hypothetical protein DPMN_006630 [Dreissena polymorpha]